jgi:hypothetical protein
LATFTSSFWYEPLANFCPWWFSWASASLTNQIFSL